MSKRGGGEGKPPHLQSWVVKRLTAKLRKNDCWVKKKLPCNNVPHNHRHRYFDESDEFQYHKGKVEIISVDQKIIEDETYLDDGSKVLTGFVDIEKLIRVKDNGGESRIIFLEKILPFQILQLELEHECHHHEE